jgi:sugar (pentulose or hexulose) kinase
MEYRMVFDSGSKALKCAIADENNKIISIESLKPEIIRSEDGFGRTCNPDHYWENLLKLAETAIKKANINPHDIRYITSTAIRPSCVFSDSDFNPLYIGASFDIRGID